MKKNQWQPSAEQSILKLRAAIYHKIRAYFMEQQVMEVDTPIGSRFGNSDPSIESLQTNYQGQGVKDQLTLYLQTSPEFFMKRLLAAGSGSIYQIATVFRQGEMGRYHHPEFKMLEWYRLDFSLHQLMHEVATLCQTLFDCQLKVEYYQYHQLFMDYFNIDIEQADDKMLAKIANQHQQTDLYLDKNGWLDYLLSHWIIPNLDPQVLTFIYYFPIEQASLARIKSGNPAVAERFEMIYQGIELANGFHELDDPMEQKGRFEAENKQRKRLNLPLIPIDDYLIDALAAGLPDCSGVALGLDRLLMIKAQKSMLEEVLSFNGLS